MDVVGAAETAANLTTPQPANPGGPVLPGAPAPDAGAGAGSRPPVAETPRDRRDAREDDEQRDEERERSIESRVFAKITETYGAARAGALSSKAEDFAASAVGAIPVVGGAAAATVKGALLAEKYGPAITAALEQAVPAEARPLMAEARRATEGFSRGLAAARSYLDAAGEAIEATSEVAGAQARLTGNVDVEFTSRFAMARYSIARQINEAERFRRIYNMEKAGAAAGGVVSDAIDRLRASLGGAMGR